jgi:hypothetical protein
MDTAGRRVPAGLYFGIIAVQGPGEEYREERRLLVYFCGYADNLDAPQTLTDANGDYRIEMGLLPLGETLSSFDDTGAFLGEFTVSDSLFVQAGVYTDPVWRATSSGVRIADRSQDLQVDLTLP